MLCLSLQDPELFKGRFGIPPSDGEVPDLCSEFCTLHISPVLPPGRHRQSASSWLEWGWAHSRASAHVHTHLLIQWSPVIHSLPQLPHQEGPQTLWGPQAAVGAELHQESGRQAQQVLQKGQDEGPQSSWADTCWRQPHHLIPVLRWEGGCRELPFLFL